MNTYKFVDQKKREPLYLIASVRYRPSGSKYRKFVLQFYRKSGNHRFEGEDPSYRLDLEIQWQGDPDSNHWYAPSIEISQMSDVGILTLERAVRMAKIATPPSQHKYSFASPEDLWKHITSKGALEVKYDGRISGLVPIDQLAPESFTAWYIDGDAARISYGYGTVLAQTKKDAQALLAQKILQSGRNNRMEDLHKFLDSEQPVRPLRYGLLSLNFQPISEQIVCDFYKGEVVEVQDA